MLELGGNIVLQGFKEVDRSSMTIIKKLVGNSAKKFADYCPNFNNLKVVLKHIHEKEGNPKFNLHISVDDGGKLTTSEVTERNLFVGLSSGIQKVETQLRK